MYVFFSTFRVICKAGRCNTRWSGTKRSTSDLLMAIEIKTWHLLFRHGWPSWALWWLCGVTSKGLSNSTMKSYAVDKAVSFYLVFCSFTISSLEFWLVCMEDVFSSHSFRSASYFPFASFRIVLWELKFWCTGSYDSAGLLLCNVPGCLEIRGPTSWRIPSLSPAKMGHGNENPVLLQLHVQAVSA